MSKIAIVIHGGATEDSDFIRENLPGYKAALAEAAQTAYDLLENGKTATDAVEAAIQIMEDNLLFNSGHGSALNAEGKVQMDAAIMEGENCKSGAVAAIENAKNPISVAKMVMEETNCMLLGGRGANEFAVYKKAELEEQPYFITPHQTEAYKEKCNSLSQKEIDDLRNHGTVGAVALDKDGNIAAGTSTGGTVMNRVGRIGDSPLIGLGCYADNNTCAVSGTGDGEYLMRSMAAGYVSVLMEQTMLTLQQAVDYVVHTKNKGIEGDMGLISVDRQANIAIAFNSEVMHRAWISSDESLQVKVYKKD